MHEQVVKCPHCGERTGVAIDPSAAAMARGLAEMLKPPPAAPAPTYQMNIVTSVEDQAPVIGVAADMVAAVVRTAVGVVRSGEDDDSDDAEPIARATARKRDR